MKWCCGQHIQCEEGLLKEPEIPIDYYDDDELDHFYGYSSDAYSGEEINQFREILYTLWESDVPGWIKSLQLRGIELPDSLKDEVFIILDSK
jgi:hypothetical protein